MKNVRHKIFENTPKSQITKHFMFFGILGVISIVKRQKQTTSEKNISQKKWQIQMSVVSKLMVWQLFDVSERAIDAIDLNVLIIYEAERGCHFMNSYRQPHIYIFILFGRGYSILRMCIFRVLFIFIFNPFLRLFILLSPFYYFFFV